MQEQDLIDKLRKIERLHAGATTPGEREAAADAINSHEDLGPEVTIVHPPAQREGYIEQVMTTYQRAQPAPKAKPASRRKKRA